MEVCSWGKSSRNRGFSSPGLITGGYMNNGRIISLPLFCLRILRMIIPVPKWLDLEEWTGKPW
jgi:hypothetical protein